MTLVRLRSIPSRIPQGVRDGMLLFGSTTIVNAGNYAFNLILGRSLGPAAFADVNLIITLFLVVTFGTVALQMAAAKFVAGYAASDKIAQIRSLRSWLAWRAWLFGLALLALFGLGAPFWQYFFQTASFWPFVIFALGVPCYFALGVDRGILQGQTRFGVLALNYQAEMWARLMIAVALVLLGWSVYGAVAALTISIVLAWLLAVRSTWSLPAADALDADERSRVTRFVGPVIAALVGQILINNSDVLIVKHFFDATDAGRYAALALIGRIVFFATWSIVTVLFPMVAQRHQRGEAHRHLLYVALGVVIAISLCIVAATLFVPELIVVVLFGSEYTSIAPLLGLYAIATALYALANVVISYRLSLDNGGGSMLALFAGVAQVGGLWIFHHDLREVVLVQIAIMACLLVALLVWDGWLAVRQRLTALQIVPFEPTPEIVNTDIST